MIRNLRQYVQRPYSSAHHEKHSQCIDVELKVLEQQSLKKTTVIVIGAGLAGSFAGWLLQKQGAQVTVLEASNRCGGRVHSLDTFSPGRKIEVGAELIGANHFWWLTLARRFQLSCIPLISEEQYKQQGLKPTYASVINSATMKALERSVSKVLHRISQDAALVQNPERPWEETTTIQAWDHISLADKLREWRVGKETWRVIERELENNNAAPIDQQSYLSVLCQVKGYAGNMNCDSFWDEVEVFRCAQGNQTLCDCLCTALDVKYQESVQAITSLSQANKVQVHTTNQCYEADFVIVSIPPPALQRLQTSPQVHFPLPPMGPALKFLLQLSSRIWTHSGCSPNGLLETAETWEPTESQFLSTPPHTFCLTIFAASARNGVQSPSKLLRQVRYLWGPLPIVKSLYTTTIGYSYMPLGYSTTQASFWSQPCTQLGNRVLWAGEHTSPAYYGYMEGALLSAVKAVKLLHTTSAFL